MPTYLIPKHAEKLILTQNNLIDTIKQYCMEQNYINFIYDKEAFNIYKRFTDRNKIIKYHKYKYIPHSYIKAFKNETEILEIHIKFFKQKYQHLHKTICENINCKCISNYMDSFNTIFDIQGENIFNEI